MLKLRELDVSKLDMTRSMIFIGGSGRGKSHALKSILYHHRDIETGVVMASCERADPFYTHFIPPIFVYDEFQPEKIEDLICLQEKKKRAIDAKRREAEAVKNSGRLEAAKALYQEADKLALKFRKFVILDDLGWKRGFTSSDTIRKIMMNGRHWGMAFLLCLQYSIDLNASVRSSAGYIFATAEGIFENRKRLFHHYFGVFRTQTEFEPVFEACTRDFGMLVIDQTSRSTRPEDCLFHYRAPAVIPPFRMCSPSAWAYSAAHFSDRKLREADERLKAKRKGASVILGPK
jgi:hypothetical protein